MQSNDAVLEHMKGMLETALSMFAVRPCIAYIRQYFTQPLFSFVRWQSLSLQSRMQVRGPDLRSDCTLICRWLQRSER